MPLDYDIVIAGGGMVGASFACALGDSPLRCCVVDPLQPGDRRQSTYDDRGISLSLSSRHILGNLNIWQHLETTACPIKHIHVSSRGQFGIVTLSGGDAGLSELGYVAAAHDLGASIHARLKQFDNIDLLCPARIENFEIRDDAVTTHTGPPGKSDEIRCKLLVAADGSGSALREKAGIGIKSYDYRQTAIVCSATFQRPNHHTAFERFTEHGPIALLPRGGAHSNLIYTVNTEQADDYIRLPAREFTACLESEFGRRFGKIEKINRKNTYPLQYIEANRQYRPNLILLGNSAHTLHPNGAQGFNLGLRDAATLAATLLDGVRDGTDVGNIALLTDYIHRRSADQRRIIDFTRRLASLFYSSFIPKRLLRNKLMLLLAHNTAARRRLIQLLTGLQDMQAGSLGIQPHT